ncbi:hypothetical protein ACFX2J_041906 [Malus domestica]
MEVVKGLDLRRYMGRWYEIASVPSQFQPKNDENTRATYTLKDDGTVNVLNKTWIDGNRGAPARVPKPESRTLPLQVLVPGCGTSHLSEHLYNAGFKAITNIDLSKVAISDMLCRNARICPGMKWQVMDVTDMQFEDESFDVVVDKGGFDAFMDPEFGVQMQKNRKIRSRRPDRQQIRIR